ncbi:MAG: DUF3037 domain-containing protein [Acidobacteriota bacterium]
MSDKQLFEYAVIRLVPCVDRQEFLNVGIILYSKPQNFLKAEFELNETRLDALCRDTGIGEIKEHLDAFARICEGGETAGPIGKLSPGDRFRWLTAPRSTIVQTSPVHTGLLTDAAQTLDDLLTKMVR